MADNEQNSSVDETMESHSSGRGRAAVRGARNVARNAKKAKGIIKTAAKGTGLFSKLALLATPVGWVLLIIAVVIIAILSLIGTAYFLLNMPGNITNKLKKLSSDVAIAIAGSWTGEDVSSGIGSEEEIALAEYVESMGYNLKGFGFADSVVYYTADDQEVIDGTKSEGDIKSITPTEVQNEDKKDVLFAYVFASERMYAIKHQGITNLAAWKQLFSALTGNAKVTEDYSGANDGSIFDKWGEGMINIDTAGWDNGNAFSVAIDAENKTMILKRKSSDSLGTDYYEYKLDGWIGRYGCPLELSLTLHLATMSPEFVYQFIMNENLQSVVNIGLDPIEYTVSFYIDNKNGEREEIKLGSNDKAQMATDAQAFSSVEYTTDEDGNYVVNPDTMPSVSETSLRGLKLAMENTEVSVFGWGSKTIADEELDAFINANYLTPVDRSTPLLYICKITDNDEEDTTCTDSELITITKNSEDDRLYDYTYNKSEDSNYSGTAFKMYGLNNIKTVLLNKNKLLINSENFNYDGTTQDFTHMMKADYLGVFQYIDQYFYDAYATTGVEGKDNLKYKDEYANALYSQYTDRFNAWVDNIEEKYKDMDIANNPSRYNEFIECICSSDIFTYFDDNGEFHSVESLQSIIDDIQADFNTISSARNNADAQIQAVCNYYGITPEIVESICEDYDNTGETVSTYTPYIESVEKHWYKDLSFKDSYGNKTGSSIVTAYEGNTGDAKFYIVLTPIGSTKKQTAEPYVIKGDVNGTTVTQYNTSDKTEETLDTSVIDGTEKYDDNYNWGDGFITTKKLFTNGWYYVYDGTDETAKAIQNALIWESENGYTNYNGVTDTFDNGKSAEDLNEFWEENNYYKNEAITVKRQKVTFDNKNSLAALAMLEQMHSLDSEYIYRDLKEMLIELGYFTSSEFDLIESDVLDWFIEGYSPSSWPPTEDAESSITNYGITLKAQKTLEDGTITEGFEPGLNVITPGAGQVMSVDSSTIEIKFLASQDSELLMVDGMTIIINGINVDDNIKVGDILAKETVIGVTTTSNIQVIMKDAKGALINNIEDYIVNDGVEFTGQLSEQFYYYLGVLIEGMPITSDNYFSESNNGVNQLNGEQYITVGPGIYLDSTTKLEMVGGTSQTDLNQVFDKQKTIDAYIQIVDGVVATIQAEFEGSGITLTQNQMEALVLTAYQRGTGSSSTLYDVIDEIKAGDSNLQSIWESYSGDLDGVRRRREAEYILYSQGIYTTVYDDSHTEITWLTDTPFTDALSGIRSAEY